MRDELALLELLRDSPAYGPDSKAARLLSGHLTNEVARYTGVELEHKRKIAWGTVATAMIIGLPSAYLTYKLNIDGFSWFSLISGAVAGFMIIGGLGVLFITDASADQEDA